MTGVADPLIIPRRLAIALLAEAQRGAGSPVRGVIVARDGVPATVRPAAEAAGDGETVWAHYRSGSAPAEEARAGRELVISVDTKGVLQLRCREVAGTQVVERELRII